MLSVKEAAEIKGCSEQYLRKLIREGKIPSTRVGKTWMIDDSFLEIEFDTEPTSNSKVQDFQGLRKPSKTKLNVLSFFSGAMGLDLGLEKAGLNVLLACEIDESSKKTIRKNESEIGLIGDIREYSTADILRFANCKDASFVDVIVGGPPCQAFSTAGKRLGFEDERGNVFLRYIDLITEIRPRYAVLENVRGLLSSTMTIKVDDEVTRNAGFDLGQFPGSSLYYVVKKLELAGYLVSFQLYNSANYGVPQIRERVVIICTRLDSPVPYLKPTHSENGKFGLKPWVTFGDAVADLNLENVNFINFSEKRLKYLNMLGPGENWRNLPKDVQESAMGNSFHLGGGKTGFYRRLSWDRPAPTLVTHPAMPATELAHPTLPRPLAIEEYKRVQQFPDSWELQGPLLDQYKQVGNAVPVGLGMAIGNAIIQHHKGLSEPMMEGFQYSRYKQTSDKEFLKELLGRAKKKQPVAIQGTLDF